MWIVANQNIYYLFLLFLFLFIVIIFIYQQCARKQQHQQQKLVGDRENLWKNTAKSDMNEPETRSLRIQN